MSAILKFDFDWLHTSSFLHFAQVLWMGHPTVPYPRAPTSKVTPLVACFIIERELVSTDMNFNSWLTMNQFRFLMLY